MKALVFDVDGKKFRMSADAIKAFREEYRSRGNGWRVLCGCAGCGVVCFEGNICDCPGHTAQRRGYDIANHRTVANVSDVVERLKRLA